MLFRLAGEGRCGVALLLLSPLAVAGIVFLVLVLVFFFVAVVVLWV